MARQDTKSPEELSDRALRDRLKRANETLDAIERSDPSETVRSGKADQLLAQGEQALATVREAEEEIGRRDHRSLPERLRLNRALRDGKRQAHPASRWLDEARRYNAPEIQGGVLYALWATFTNDSTALFPGSRFEGEGDDRTLVLPATAGADIHTFGRIAGSSVNTGASGHVRPWAAIHTLALNDWIVVERSVSEMRIRLGERARKLDG